MMQELHLSPQQKMQSSFLLPWMVHEIEPRMKNIDPSLGWQLLVTIFKRLTASTRPFLDVRRHQPFQIQLLPTSP